MLEVPRRPQRISVALPGSFTRDIPHLREKTSRAGTIARALAIFRVDEVLIYNDHTDNLSEKEGRLFEKLLSFQETPQYLRRAVFAWDLELQFAGILPPLRLPSHPSAEKPRNGLIREAIAVATGPSSLVDAGLQSHVLIHSRLKQNERVTIRLTRTEPTLEGEIIDTSRLPIYWGFRVTRTSWTLGRLIKGEKPDLTISTSRKGRSIREVLPELTQTWKSTNRALVVFGSPDAGVPEILEKEKLRVEEEADFNINVVPNQGVETIRTEEALLATLSVINLLEEN